MKILSWNIRQGGGSRIAKILGAIKAESPDVVALNEWHNNKSGLQLQIGLLRLGYSYQVVSAASATSNTAFIASKYPCSSMLHHSIDKHYNANIVTAQFEIFDIHSVYFPHKKHHTLFDYFNTENKSDRPQIIVGDYNTGINGSDQAGSSFWYEEDFKQLLSSGYIDAYRHVHGATYDYSWYSHQGNGYRYDHTLVSDILVPLISDCRYLHEYRESGISDHSPMLLLLKTD